MDNIETKRIFKLEIASLIFCLIFSFVNHFLFEWTNNCMFLASFVPINESVWEHGKLLFMPFLFASFVLYPFLGDNKNFIFAKSLPLVLCTPLMITFFYTYTGIIGSHVTVVDILMAVAIIIAMHIFSYKVLVKKGLLSHHWLLLIVIVWFVMFSLFTFYPPNLPLFIPNN